MAIAPPASAMQHTFSVYAPTSERVDIVCSAWRGEPRPMRRDEHGTWSLVADLPPGVYRYSYRLRSKSWFSQGETVDIADPLARILDAAGECCELTLPMPDLANDYAWRHDGVPQPPHDQMIIYEMFVQDFPGERGTFPACIERLGHVADLGFTALELMPLMGADKQRGWGYTPRFFFAVDPRFGSEAELCALVDAAHGRGMLVLFDGVYNHASCDCPLAHIDHDAYFHHAPKDAAQSWGPQFNYDLCIPGTAEFPARHFIKRKVSHWIRRFHFDGIRYDAVSQMRERHFLGELAAWAREVAGGKPFYAIAECLPLDLSLVGPAGPVDACWNDCFHQKMRPLLAGQWNGDDLEQCFDCRRLGFPSGLDAVNYLASHDAGHTVHDLIRRGLGEEAAIARMRLGFCVLFTAVGLPMVWMGDEFGCMDPPTQDPHPLPWRLLAEDPRRAALRDLVRDLIRLRRATPALRGDGCTFVLRDDERRILVAHRWDGGGGRVLIAVHAGDGDVEAAFRAPAPGPWRDALAGGSVGGADLALALGPWQARILIGE